MRKVMDMLKDISLWNIIKKIYVKKIVDCLTYFLYFW